MKDDRLYLHHILERCERIARFIVTGKSSFMESERLQDAVIRNIEVIGEAAKRVSAETRARLPQLDWRAICGMHGVSTAGKPLPKQSHPTRSQPSFFRQATSEGFLFPWTAADHNSPRDPRLTRYAGARASEALTNRLKLIPIQIERAARRSSCHTRLATP